MTSSSTVPAQASVLDADALGQWAQSRYQLQGRVTCRLQAVGVNDTYYLSAGRDQYALRVYRHGWRTVSEVAAELRALTFASRRGVAVSTPLAATDGELVCSLKAAEGERLVVLFWRAQGPPLAGDPSPAQSRAYGRLTANLHNAFDSMQRRVRRSELGTRELLEDPVRAVQPYLEHRPEAQRSLIDTAEKVAKRIEMLPTTDGAYGLCHGDIHQGNVIFDDQGAPVLFDFDCCGYGWRAYDLVTFRWSMALGSASSKAVQARRWKQFLGAYQECRPLPAALQEAVPLFLVARTIWLLGLHARLAPQNSGLRMFNDSYFDFFLGRIDEWVRGYRIV